ncbi:MAG: pantetheine-phosphate adenylyltransferase [Eubacteriales bacterium]|nr:pantetheine-phosphate adenylyltransferase [Eubacteriales bacterium]
MKVKALFSGSFDPITLGHIDIVKTASEIFDEVYVVAFNNSEKTKTFTLDERKEIMKEALFGIRGIVIDTSEGSVSDYVKEKGIDVIVKGIRSPLDCQYETEISDVNMMLSSVKTVMIPCSVNHSRVSSSIARELIRLGKPLCGYLSERTVKKIDEILAKRPGTC